MVLAIALGAVSGIAAFVPLLIGLRASRKVTQTSNFGHASILVLAIVASFAVLGGTSFLCITFARDLVMPFTVAEALGLSASAIVFGVVRLVKK